MLLVNDYQAKVFELNSFLNQGMGPDNQIGFSGSNVTQNRFSPFTFDTAGEKGDPVSGTAQKLANRVVVLFCQNFRRDHQRRLITIFDRDHHGLQSHNGFPRSNVPLKQSIHDPGAAQIISDLLQNACLSRRGLEGKNGSHSCLNALPHPNEPFLGAAFALFLDELKPQLEEVKLFENESLLGHGLVQVKLLEVGLFRYSRSRARKMDLL